MTSQTVFEIELVKQLTAQITFSACTFESQAQVYNSLHEKEDKERLDEFVQNFRRSNIHERQDSYNWLLNVTRLEEGWFMYQLKLTFNALGILGAHNFAVYNNQGGARILKGGGAEIHIDASYMCIAPSVT